MTQQTNAPQLAIGIGCSSQATTEDLLTLIRSCAAGLSPNILATLDRRAAIAEPLAATLGLKLMLFSSDHLARIPHTTVHSAAALHQTGTPSVAEASALAALGTAARLLVTRQTGHYCTCAVAIDTIAIDTTEVRP